MPSLGATTEDGVKVPRGSVRVNPVTGKMQRIEPKAGKKGDDSDEEMVREGCMMIPKKYLTGATDAGLGSSDGMYSNMGAVRRELQSSKNTGQKVGGSGSGRKSSHTPTVKTTLMNGGSRAVHQISQSSSSSTGATGAIVPRRNNIKHVVQGRARTMRNGTVSAKEAEESAYSKEKGVVSTFGGATSAKTRKYQEEKRDKAKKGIAQISSGSGGRSFVKLDKGAGAGGVGKPKVSAAPGGIGSGSMSAIRKKNAGGARASSTNKLGGISNKATSSSSSSSSGGSSARGSRSVGVSLGGGGGSSGGAGGAGGGAAAQRAARAKFFEEKFAAKP